MAELRLKFFACDVIVTSYSQGVLEEILHLPKLIPIGLSRAIAKGGVFFC